jgi:2-polyprenyl-6-methoxyphenol hydroxylase-like FAD-dependent oxidoreductase
MSGYAPNVVTPVREGGVESIFTLQPPFLEFVPPASLPHGRVTLLGDAAHSMIPFRAAGRH